MARRANNLPRQREERLSVGKRILTSGWTWVLLAAIIVYSACLLYFYLTATAGYEVQGGTVSGVNAAAVKSGAWYALPTLAFWIVVYLIADRFRPQRPLVWFLALGWGGSVAVVVSSEINTWAAAHLNVYGDGDPATATRAAIFIAPFVEEAAKATVLFWLAILVRYRLVSKVSLVCLGGLSAAGFAFVENIVYYARVIVYASHTIQAGDVASAVEEIRWLRGFWTAFGHPLFTMMTAIGVAIAVRTHSKVVRVMAPLAGYLLAAAGHMLFNSQASLAQGTALYLMYWTVAIPLVVAAVIYVVRQELAQGRMIYNRLTDYVRVGWLMPSDPEVFASLRLRLRSGLVAVTYGWSAWLATLRLQQVMTELAYLRDAEVSGIVDSAAGLRAEELLLRIRALRQRAVSDPRKQKVRLPSLPRFKNIFRKRSRLPGSGGQTGYSAINPSWGPPGS